jgi:hypothetical protein
VPKPSVQPATQIFYSYLDVPTIEKFSESNAFIRGVMGPFGSGKSSGCVMEIYQRSIQQKPGPDNTRRTRWACIRNTYPQLKDTTIKTFLGSEEDTTSGWFPPQHFGSNYNKSDHDYIMSFPLADGTRVVSEVLFRALDRPDHVKKVLSMELTGAWINEAREVPKAIFEAIQGRVGRFPAYKDGGCSWSGVILDTNPPDIDHWWYKFFEEFDVSGGDEVTLQCPVCLESYQFKASKGRCRECGTPYMEIFKQPSGRSDKAENLNNLPPNYYANLMIGKGIEFIKVYVDGEYGFVQDGKPVYPNFKDSIHVAKEDIKPIPNIPLILGWDFGLTPACVICQLTPMGRLNVLQEFVTTNMGIREMAQDIVAPALKTVYWQHKIISKGDHAGNQRSQTDERTCFQELRDAGIESSGARTNSPVARINAVDHFLRQMVGGQPAFQMSPSCLMLRKGFNGQYRFRRMQVVGDERYTDQPEKNMFSHVHDALQYAAMECDGNVKTQNSMSTVVKQQQTQPPEEAYR